MKTAEYRVEDLLPVGTRIRSVSNHDLTGTVDRYEWMARDPQRLSAIPYAIAWDNPTRARVLRGWLFPYATPEGIEAIDA